MDVEGRDGADVCSIITVVKKREREKYKRKRKRKEREKRRAC